MEFVDIVRIRTCDCDYFGQLCRMCAVYRGRLTYFAANENVNISDIEINIDANVLVMKD